MIDFSLYFSFIQGVGEAPAVAPQPNPAEQEIDCRCLVWLDQTMPKNAGLNSKNKLGKLVQ